MEEFDQLAAPGYPVFLGSEIKQPPPEDAFFHIHSLTIIALNNNIGV